MPCIEFRIASELISSSFSLTEVDNWADLILTPINSVPRTVRYRHHPRVGPSNPQLPRTRYNKAFRGHRFKVGRSKK